MSATPGPATCGSCLSLTHPGARFCEECGGPLASGPGVPDAPDGPLDLDSAPTVPRVGARVPPRPGPVVEVTPCRECAGAIDGDGYCTQCGTKAPLPRDHMVAQPQPWVAAVSDRGIRHHRNEDAAAVAADPDPGSWAALVVCDGVSTSESSDVASLAAVLAARAELEGARGTGLASGSALLALAEKRLRAAGAAAAHAVEVSTDDDHGDSPPSCTFVAATLEGDQVAVGNVGDSRAYWLPDAGAAQVLTTDDSWIVEQLAQGTSREDAEADARAHAITRWIGVDSHDQVPHVTHHTLTGPGWLLLCTDGLWNYCSPASVTAQVVARAAAVGAGAPLATAQELVRWANEQGGKDNITVALARVGARTHEGDPT